MKVGEMTPVMNTGTGAQFFKLESNHRFDHAAVRVGARADRRPACRRENGWRVKKYLQRLRGQAIIEWKNDDLRKAWEIGVAAEPTF